MLPNTASDHTPILLKVEDLVSEPKLFKFELMWLEIHGFKEKIKSWWQEMDANGTASFVFGQKLMILKEKILLWKNTEFGGLETRKNPCLGKLRDPDHNTFFHPHQDVDAQVRSEVLSEYNRLLRIEEIS